MVRKSRKKRKIRVLKRIAFWGIIVFISCTGMYFYRKYKDIQLQNIVSHTTENEGIEERLQKMSNYDLRIKDIVENKSQYPEELLELLTTNIETIEFVLNYPEKKNNSPAETVEETRSGEIPLLLQWDERWGYQNYGDSMFAVNGCGPTALSMVIVGLTENKQATPYQVAQYAEKNGYYVEGVGSSWNMMTDVGSYFGIQGSEIPLGKDSIQTELELGHPIICAMRPGDFTTTGHFIVLAGMKDGKICVHDPNSKKRSEKLWDYETLEGQINNLWSFTTLF